MLKQLNIQFLFNQPNKHGIKHKRLVEDIEKAKRRVLIATPYFSHTPISDAIQSSEALKRSCIINIYKEDVENFNISSSLRSLEDLLRHNLLLRMNNSQSVQRKKLIEINGIISPKSKTLMHHKFLICDDVVWFGSYNFTEAAESNYETICRIEDKQISTEFTDQFILLLTNPQGLIELTHKFYCSSCHRIKDFNFKSIVVPERAPEGYVCCNDSQCRNNDLKAKAL